MGGVCFDKGHLPSGMSFKTMCLSISLLLINFIHLGFGINLPDDFIVGFATASYQVEGAWNEDGKFFSN